MLKTFFFVAVFMACSGVGVSQTPDPMTAVRQYMDSFNKGDVKGMVAVCATQTTILDGMAPHSWQGSTACADWYRDVLIEGEQHGASGYVVTLGKPRQLDVKGDAAYVVLPASMSFKLKGKQVTQTGATWTLALRKEAGDW